MTVPNEAPAPSNFWNERKGRLVRRSGRNFLLAEVCASVARKFVA
jgi:hypothetical protein